jgi:hypothetical protein
MAFSGFSEGLSRILLLIYIVVDPMITDSDLSSFGLCLFLAYFLHPDDCFFASVEVVTRYTALRPQTKHLHGTLQSLCCLTLELIQTQAFLLFFSSEGDSTWRIRPICLCPSLC